MPAKVFTNVDELENTVGPRLPFIATFATEWGIKAVNVQHILSIEHDNGNGNGSKTTFFSRDADQTIIGGIPFEDVLEEIADAWQRAKLAGLI